ncbi:Yif1 family [Parasponia andersonii]|uniref:Yif1 family n=1 Tax=Parasponia andersonii TaxID=3476 RepID=A0A2P5AZJ6_PARAD|nr:Yif1 family [Parasponia andersonii]
MRTREIVEGNFVYKPPMYDVNAPDLYIPLMAFGNYVILSGFFIGINGK